jgi:hypothetical protein
MDWHKLTNCQETVLLSEQVEEVKTGWKWLLEIMSSGIKRYCLIVLLHLLANFG